VKAPPDDTTVETREAPAQSPASGVAQADGTTVWLNVAATLGATVNSAPPPKSLRAAALGASLESSMARLASEGATPQLAEALARDCDEARRVFRQHHQLLDQLSELCTELIDGLTEVAEDDRRARGQCTAMRARLAEDSSVRRRGALRR
jgi:diguanylate cyclase